MGSMGVISSVFSALMDSIWSGLFKTLRPQQFLVFLTSFHLNTKTNKSFIVPLIPLHFMKLFRKHLLLR